MSTDELVEYASTSARFVNFIDPGQLKNTTFQIQKFSVCITWMNISVHEWFSVLPIYTFVKIWIFFWSTISVLESWPYTNIIPQLYCKGILIL